MAAEQDKKNHERMQALIDQLQGKVKSYKKQIEEAEYCKVAGALGFVPLSEFIGLTLISFFVLNACATFKA